ncbi:MAG: hydrogenase iron-sulfur subunit [Gammaproteobacteria bacterium]|nr:hydrogenase iron-sulfur subunit [Gammaproteobacteria bacterium]
MVLRSIARNGFERLENGFDWVFSPAWNPLYQLGALGWFFYWIVCVSGIYLYIFFDTGINDAYESLEYITNVQWYAGGVMRSLHRYASDAMVIVVILHLLREYVMDRYRGVRWFAWITGVPLLWFLIACGISGYWMVWDILAQYVATVTTEWLDALPIFGEPIARNFLNEATLGSRFFTLMVFIHIALPLIMLFVMWIHIQRHAQPKVNPPRGLAAGTMAMLLVLSLVYPAVSQAPANLDTVPSTVGIDWFYLPVYPLLDVISGATLWAIVGAATLLLLCLPWLPKGRRHDAAVVDLGNCNGCGRCYNDCPYSAVTMELRTDGLPYARQAVVNPNQCTGCGLCVGACPTATPFRRASALVPGIDLLDFNMRDLRERTLTAAKALSGTDRVMVFGCQAGADLSLLEGPSVAVLPLRCIGMLPPPFIDFMISRHHVDGVLLTGCREGDCHYRLGIKWTEQRLSGLRDPYLRKRVPRERISQAWYGPTQSPPLVQHLEAFRGRLREIGPLPRRKRRVKKTSVQGVDSHG